AGGTSASESSTTPPRGRRTTSSPSVCSWSGAPGSSVLLRLLTLPLTAPIAGIRYCLEKVAEVAEKEMWDEAPVREQLILENQAYEEGQIDEATFRVREAELL